MTEGKDNTKKTAKTKKTRTTKGIWNWTKYFVMKWRFRIDQARALFGLITFAALLAVGYFEYITFFYNQGFWGIIEFTLIIFVVFLIGGYLYDRVFRLWAETQTVNVERNPFTYVPGPKEYINHLATFSFIFMSLTQIAEKLDIDLEAAEYIRLHMKTYYDLTTSKENFDKEALKLKEISKKIQTMFLESGKMKDYEEFFNAIEEEKLKSKALKEVEKNN